ncbi:Mur ligase family protein [Engelhardtia mirabilis]|uniref:Cyanophycin synthetase n=1 Tax=Engelhardtia mirabilis TaxID=2528011 RepID=A0A518BF34_9BACT|nr:Cyanophycin synthetase [Planctomycetes bacterium Pla133]QDU99916.1 Cyanophycin synthetase [Planctomycetes bacterium Pla86]
MTSPTVRDSRRITGLHPYTDRPGAILELEIAPELQERAIAAWRAVAAEVAAAVGWLGTPLHARRHPDGVSLIMEAPIDALYAACEVNELAWSLTARALADGGEVEQADLEGELLRVQGEIAAEARPALLALHAAALEHGAAFLVDDDTVSVGHGAGCRLWPAAAPPDVAQVPWSKVTNVPTAVVTGTNGKSTTVRMLAAIAEAAGLTAGVSSTDWIRVGDEILDEGDYSGPGGARTVLRDARVQIGLLETARGGMFRRGLGVESADVACVLNVAEDHLGEWGCWTVRDLAEIKLTVAKAVGPGGRVVLNADDDLVREGGLELDLPRTWFSCGGLGAVPDGERSACVLEDGVLVLYSGDERTEIARVDQIPSTLGGAATHNVANALAAVAIADGLDLPHAAMAEGLHAFGLDPGDNPGRLNVFGFGGVTALVDFAHNPHGQRAMLEMAAGMDSDRLLVLLGQAGDRDDASVTELCRTTWAARPDRILIKSMEVYLRGREPGAMTALIERELLAAGAPPEAIAQGGEEFDCVLEALAWSRPGDLLLLFSHAERERTLEYLAALRLGGWSPGQPLPAAP